MLLTELLLKVKDCRRKQGRRYQLNDILLFSIFAVMSGAESYRKIHAFIKEHYSTLDEFFELNWKKKPAYTTIRNIIQGVSSVELENCFREHAEQLSGTIDGKRFIAFDGKVLRGSFDHFNDQKAVQILSAFLTGNNLILAHEEIEAKTNEIPSAQEMIGKLGLSNCIFTYDAVNCQKKTLEVTAVRLRNNR